MTAGGRAFQISLLLPPPSTFHHRYRVTGPLEAGTQGDVWSVVDETLQRACVLKRVPRSRQGWPRARREAALLRHLVLPGVVHLRDEWIDDDAWHLVLDRVDGAPFPGAVDPLLAVRSLCGTLAQVHRLGVLHRDLKPSNVLVDRTGHAVVLDFGLAVDRAGATADTSGTLWYVAPEILEGAAPTPASDLYAVGVMLLDALVGRREPRRPWTLAAERLEHAATLPEPAGAVVRACLAVNPQERPTASDVVATLIGSDAPPPLTLLPDGPFRHAGRELAPLLQGDDAAERFASWTASGFGRIEANAWSFHPVEVQRIRRQYMDLGVRSWQEWVEWAAESVVAWERRSLAFGVLGWVFDDRRAADDHAGALQALEVMSALALFQEDREYIEDARLACERQLPHPTFLADLLRTAVEARFQRRFKQCALPPLPEGATPLLAWAHKLVWTWIQRQDPKALASGLEADLPSEPATRALHLRWLGIARYAVGDYRGATDAFEERSTLGVPLSPADLSNAASALLELGELGRARELADEALAGLSTIWNPSWEAQLTWLVRHIDYRAGASLSARPELVDASEQLGLTVTGQLALNEAAIAWRAGAREQAVGLARRAERHFRQRRRSAPAALASAFAGWLAGEPGTGDVDASAEPSDLTMQTRAFILAASHRRDAQSVEAVIARPPDTWSLRLDLLSTDEALAMARGEDPR